MPKKLSAIEREKRLQNPVAKYLERAFLKWQADTGVRKSQRDFADHIGIGHATLGKLMRGEVAVPEPGTIRRIAAVCGPGLYEMFGEELPDEKLDFVTENWEYLDDSEVERIHKLVQRAVARRRATADH